MTAESPPSFQEESRRVESLRTQGDSSVLPAPPHFLSSPPISSSSSTSKLPLSSPSHLWYIARCLNSADIPSLAPPTHHDLLYFPILILPFHSWSHFCDWSERGIIEISNLRLVHSAALILPAGVIRSSAKICHYLQASFQQIVRKPTHFVVLYSNNVSLKFRGCYVRFKSVTCQKFV